MIRVKEWEQYIFKSILALKKGNIHIQAMGKTDNIKEALETTKTNVSAGKCSQVSTQSFPFTLLLNVSVPHSCLHSGTSPPRGLQSIQPPFCQQHCGLDLFLRLISRDKTEPTTCLQPKGPVRNPRLEEKISFKRVFCQSLLWWAQLLCKQLAIKIPLKTT